MKAILSGDLRREPERYLSKRTFAAKAIGLILALGAGLSVGREGPFVHLSNVIAHQLMKHTSYFSSLFESETLRRQIYITACAVGVSSAFKAPIGGVLFSIEVTSTFYLVSVSGTYSRICQAGPVKLTSIHRQNYYKGFLAAVTAAVVSQLLTSFGRAEAESFETLYPTHFEKNSFAITELLAFLSLGVLAGFLGPLFIYFSDKVKDSQYRILHAFPVAWPCMLCALVSTILFIPGECTRGTFEKTIYDLLSEEPLPTYWGETSQVVILSMMLALMVRVVATALSLSIPVPAGDFIPTFVIGSFLGRVFGETLAMIFPGAKIMPGGYAIVGASAFLGSVTHAFSSAGRWTRMTLFDDLDFFI